MTLARHVSSPPSARITRAKAAEENHSAVQNARAARTVASHAADAEDCGELLAMLGLDVTEGTLRGTTPTRV
jgi:hypothetical protein